MTQSLSFIVADRPPAMYRIEAVAIVVSRISMNVGITTAVATIQGLTAGRLTAFTLRAAALIQGLLRDDRWVKMNPDPLTFKSFIHQAPPRPSGMGAAGCEAPTAPDTAGPCGRGRSGLKTSPACGPVAGSL